MAGERLQQMFPHFIDTGAGRVFALLRRPSGPMTGCVLIVPPVAEEMNKCRHMIALVGQALADRGVASITIDLYGTGDSDGEFADGDWLLWKANLRGAAAWAAEQGHAVDRLLGVRLGCALAAEIAQELVPHVDRTVFWQPVLSGARWLDQFLRLRVAAAMMEHDRKETTADLRRRLAGGETLEIAGYCITGKLTLQLDAVDLGAQLGAHLGALNWFEVVRSDDSPAPTPAVRIVEAARAATPVVLRTFAGEPFWSTVEIATNAELVASSVAALAAPAAARTQALRA